MRRITYHIKAKLRVDKYARNYLEYYRSTYLDSGIWSEDIIVQSYIEWSISRKNEMIETIRARLERDVPIGHSGQNTVKIPWRTKILKVSYEDIDEEERVILDLEILAT